MADVLAHSSNIGAIQIALQTGDRSLYKYQRRFGFGQKDGNRAARGIDRAAAQSGGLVSLLLSGRWQWDTRSV